MVEEVLLSNSLTILSQLALGLISLVECVASELKRSTKTIPKGGAGWLLHILFQHFLISGGVVHLSHFPFGASYPCDPGLFVCAGYF